MKISESRSPSLTRAVVKSLGGIEEARITFRDVVAHGADGGFRGFVYYSDTCAFFKRHREEIVARLEEDAESFGVPVEGLISGFRVFEDCASLDLSRAIRRALCGLRAETFTQTLVENSLAWYALEEVSREMTGM